MNAGRFIHLFLFWGLSVSVFAQTRRIDSLKKKVIIAESDKEKSGALLDLCNQKYSLPADSISKYAFELRKLNRTIPDSHYSIMADYYIAYSLLINNKEDSCLKITDYYLGTLKENNNESQAYLLFFQLKGIVYYRSGRSEETVNTFFALSNEAKRRKDTLFILMAERGIGLSYLLRGQDKEALKLFHHALSFIPDRLSAKYREVNGHLQINAGIASMHLYQANHIKGYADSAEYYADNAIRIARDEENLFILCQGLILKGLMLSYRKEYRAAEQNLWQGLNVRKIIADTLYIISDMTVLASFYANTGKPEKGIAISKKGIAMVEKQKSSPGLLLLLYNSLSENYLVAKDYKHYGETLKRLISVRDSLNNKNSSYELNYLQVQYEAEKKEKTIIEQELQITKRNYWLYSSLLFTAMGVIISWLIFINYRRRQRHKLKLMLDEEKRLSIHAVKDAEEHERKRIAADLHDNLGVYAASLSSNLNYIQPAEDDLVTQNAYLELKSNSNAIISELNDTIWVLKKEALTLTAISDRVKSFINRIKKSYPEIIIEVEEKIKNDCLLPSFQAFHLYHIIKEAINNSLKHSKGNNINIIIESNNKWRVTIKDDGVGLNKS
ncbi:MAG: ATP-binding protein, partial [Chitinophagaceae bacterium]